MGQWYQGNRKLFREERKTLASAFPLLRLAVVGPEFKINSVCTLKRECAVVHGMYNLRIPDSCRQIEYGIVLVLPSNYPKRPPQMFCNDPKLPIGGIERHIMKDGSACLGVGAEIGLQWFHDSTIADFLGHLVAPFLVWQAYYDEYGKPPWGDLSHGSQGILECYAELLGRSADSTVVGFMELLGKKNSPKGHEPCPCNSGKRLRDCHRDLVYDTRQRVTWQDLVYDLAALERGDCFK